MAMSDAVRALLEQAAAGIVIASSDARAPLREMRRGLARAGGVVVQYPALLEHARRMGDLPPGDPRVVDARGRMTPPPLRPCVERGDLSRFSAMRMPRTYTRWLAA